MAPHPPTLNKICILGSRDDFCVGARFQVGREPQPFIDTTGSKIIMGADVVMSSGVYIHTHTHQFHKPNWRELPKIESRTPTTIGDKVFLGVNAQIMHTCKYIGECSVIAAGAIVTKDVEDYEIWAGNPARKIGDVQA